jgi:hypothetical protein
VVIYPLLTEEQQGNLPQLLAAPQALPIKFEDSTHQLWQCETEEGEMVLKVCRHQAVSDSSFWLGINALFDLHFPQSLSDIEQTHQFLEMHGHLAVPPFVSAKANAFVMTLFLSGQDLEQATINEQDVQDLAKHLASLHMHTSSKWGTLHQPQQSAASWSIQLQNTLVMLREHSKLEVPADIFDQAMTEAASIDVDSFVPLMLDLRWDQLRRLDSGELAVMDLDAFVRGPREFDFVLLEYLLNPEQFGVFKEVYQQSHSIPNIEHCRYSYRLLLFLMNAFGDVDIQVCLEQIRLL